jgi:hypothetical protein
VNEEDPELAENPNLEEMIALGMKIILKTAEEQESAQVR